MTKEDALKALSYIKENVWVEEMIYPPRLEEIEIDSRYLGTEFPGIDSSLLLSCILNHCDMEIDIHWEEVFKDYMNQATFAEKSDKEMDDELLLSMEKNPDQTKLL